MAREAALTQKRLTPHLNRALGTLPEIDRQIFLNRLNAHLPALFSGLYELYGARYDFFYHLEMILTTAAEMYAARPSDLKALDGLRETHPNWYLSEVMMGAVCYVDRFARDLVGIQGRLPYLRELGVTYLHLMPLFLSPEKQNDGGYAVSSFREVNPALGSMKDLADLSRELRANGISLVLDFVFNHTSDEHEWAKRALAGDPEYQDY
ncbi:MAG: amylosucrase, partial [Phototrophicales bacterium]